MDRKSFLRSLPAVATLPFVTKVDDKSIEGQIGKLKLESDDMIVLSFDQPITAHEMEVMKREFGRMVSRSSIPVVAIPANVKIGVMKRPEIEELKRAVWRNMSGKA